MFSATKGGSPSGYQISRSVRLRSSASAYLNRTPTVAGNRTTWTWSGWVKRGALTNAAFSLFGCGANNTNDTICYFGPGGTGDTLDIIVRDTSIIRGRLTTTAVYRDPAAWYHFVVTWDSSNATSADRFRLYVNGSRVTAFSTETQPPQNTQSLWNSTQLAYIARLRDDSTNYFDGYITEVNFIDGQALTPSSFGETNPVTGVWQPKKYTGTYGTNGFYLNFSDNSAATAAAIGKDYSGNGNNWTPNNISVTAGTTYDSMLDVPTQWADGGNGRGNYAVLNPIGVPFANGTITDGNLKFAGLTTTDKGVAATISISSGAFYWESTQLTNSGSSNCYAGVILTGASSDVNANRVYVRGDGLVLKYGTSLGTVFSTFTNNDVIGFAFDRANNTLAIYKNGTLGYTVTGLNNADHTPWVGGYTTTDTWAVNFGQRPFSYTPPTGFKALNTLNLPTPTILKGNQYFDVSLWTGTGSAQSITNSGGMQPDFVWGKIRSGADYHVLANSVVGADKFLKSNATDAETTNAQTITAFNSNGFSVGTSTDLNRNTYTFVGWQWKEGATQGFDIVTYTGNGANRTIAHNLGVAPKMMIVKSRSSGTYSWAVYHASTGAGNYLTLNATTASTALAAMWNSTAPTSSVFSVGTDNWVNANAATYVAYLFSEVAGFSKFGTWQNNNSTDGTFIYLGFRPRFILLKNSDNVEGWFIWDSARQTYNMTPPSSNWLNPNLSNAEGANNATTAEIDGLSNGFKIRTTNPATGEISFGTRNYIYAAFAEVPFRYALAR